MHGAPGVGEREGPRRIVTDVTPAAHGRPSVTAPDHVRRIFPWGRHVRNNPGDGEFIGDTTRDIPVMCIPRDTTPVTPPRLASCANVFFQFTLVANMEYTECISESEMKVYRPIQMLITDRIPLKD